MTADEALDVAWDRLIEAHGDGRSWGARWHQTRTGTSQYVPATDEEKAAALDAALDFEDALVNEVNWVNGVKEGPH